MMNGGKRKIELIEYVGLFLVAFSFLMLVVNPGGIGNLFNNMFNHAAPIIIKVYITGSIGIAIIISVTMGRLLERLGFTDALMRIFVPLMKVIGVNAAVAVPSVYNILGDINAAGRIGGPILKKSKATKDEQKIAHELFLLTSKPVMYVCNVDEASAVNGNKYVDMVREAVKDENAEILVVAAKTEADIAELETYEDRQMFLAEVGLEESGVARLIKSAYKLLNLETYFTAGVQEVRAWTYEKGWKAPQCAGVIHTDFEKGFIRAEVIKYDDYIQYGSEAAVKEAGKLGVEGKEYVVQDGDIMHFRFNV